MAGIDNHELSNIPYPTEKDNCPKPLTASPFFGGFPEIRSLLKHIQLDDILLLGLIILVATDDDCDNFLLVLLIIIFIAGFDKQLFPFL
ncbi:MAG: hypothetical protein GX144_12845 [Clostridiaceae bacterium]|jgi:hypothetical protein|nr:hypothetical protein [Clostridiaceae bacterium]